MKHGRLLPKSTSLKRLNDGLEQVACMHTVQDMLVRVARVPGWCPGLEELARAAGAAGLPQWAVQPEQPGPLGLWSGSIGHLLQQAAGGVHAFRVACTHGSGRPIPFYTGECISFRISR
eukprot:1161838-Pelagomonas_calceolata.AAC.3